MKNFFKVLLAMMLVLTICLSVVACNNGTETPDNGDETPHEHSYVPTITEATCETDGYTTYTCACGDSYVADEIDALGHTHSEVTVEPTCEEKGYTTYTCNCGDTFTDEIAALGHSYVNGKCEVCGKDDPANQPPHEHVYGDNGMCECGEIDPDFQGGVGDGGDEDEYDFIVIASAEHGGSAGFLGYVHMYINDSFSSGYDNSVAYGLNEGDKVTLYPEANSGYVFAGWYYEAENGGLGEFITLDKSYTFEVSASVKYLAHFVNANEKYPVGIMVSGYGNISVDGGEYNSSYNLMQAKL